MSTLTEQRVAFSQYDRRDERGPARPCAARRTLFLPQFWGNGGDVPCPRSRRVSIHSIADVTLTARESRLIRKRPDDQSEPIPKALKQDRSVLEPGRGSGFRWEDEMRGGDHQPDGLPEHCHLSWTRSESVLLGAWRTDEPTWKAAAGAAGALLLAAGVEG